MIAKAVHFLRFGSFAHDMHRGRDRDGKAIHICSLCGASQAIFAEQVIVGPAHIQRLDVGAVTTKAEYPDRVSKVREWRRSER